MSADPEPPSKRTFSLYLAAVITTGVALIAVTFLAFSRGIRKFLDAFPQAPIGTIGNQPVVFVALLASGLGLFGLVALIVLFGARVNRVDPDELD